MKYPAVIHTDNGIDYGAFLPDIPGVFSGGHSIEECLVNVQESVQLVYEAKKLTELPAPSPLAKVMDSEAAQGGWVMLADIDPSFLNAKAVRVNLSIPEYLLARIDKKAHANGMSRSAYMVQAALA